MVFYEKDDNMTLKEMKENLILKMQQEEFFDKYYSRETKNLCFDMKDAEDNSINGLCLTFNKVLNGIIKEEIIRNFAENNAIESSVFILYENKKVVFI